MASVLFYACVCWGGNESRHDAGRFDKLVKKVSSVVGFSLDTLLVTVERRIVRKSWGIMAFPTHPLHSMFTAQHSSFNGRLVAPRCSTERFRRSFLPHAVRLFNLMRGESTVLMTLALDCSPFYATQSSTPITLHNRSCSMLLMFIESPACFYCLGIWYANSVSTCGVFYI